MANNKINLQVITPIRSVIDEMVDIVVFKTTEGDMGILYGHEPVVALLDYGIITYKIDGKEYKATIMSGFVEVTKEKVTILTDASEKEDEIDPNRAQRAKERAEKRKQEPEMDVLRAEIALKKSLIRLNIHE